MDEPTFTRTLEAYKHKLDQLCGTCAPPDREAINKPAQGITEAIKSALDTSTKTTGRGKEQPWWHDECRKSPYGMQSNGA